MKSSSSAVGEQVSFLNITVRNYQLWAACSCCCAIAVSCLCGYAMNQKEQVKIIFFFSSCYWYFTNLSSDTGRLCVAAGIITAAVLWTVPVTDYVCCGFFCKEFLILTSSKRFCEGTSVSAAVVCLYLLFSQVDALASAEPDTWNLAYVCNCWNLLLYANKLPQFPCEK